MFKAGQKVDVNLSIGGRKIEEDGIVGEVFYSNEMGRDIVSVVVGGRKYWFYQNGRYWDSNTGSGYIEVQR